MEAERGGGGLIRRCSIHGISWPPQFTRCYEEGCGEKLELSRASDGPSLSVEEATSKKKHYEFHEYLVKTGRL